MLVAEIMHRGVNLVEPSKKVQRAADLMDLKEVGALPVVQDDSLVGLVTERDIAIRNDSAGRDPEFCTVGEIMSTTTQCFDDEDINVAVEKMKRAKLGCLPVVSRERGNVLGILSVSDIAKHYDRTLAGEIIASIS